MSEKKPIYAVAATSRQFPALPHILRECTAHWSGTYGTTLCGALWRSKIMIVTNGNERAMHEDMGNGDTLRICRRCTRLAENER